jgi:hypothetical protein
MNRFESSCFHFTSSRCNPRQTQASFLDFSRAVATTQDAALLIQSMRLARLALALPE